MVETSNKLAVQILEFLGISSDGVRKITIECKAGEPAVITTELLVVTEQRDMAEVFRHYKVVEYD